MACQSFNITNDKQYVAARIKRLRSLFKKFSITGYLIPRADAFGNEYVGEKDERLKYISGFSGSWGLACVYKTGADIFIDGRYELQIKAETDLSVFTPVPIAETRITDRFTKIFTAKSVIGYDPTLFTAREIKVYREATEKTGAKLVAIEENLIDVIRESAGETVAVTENPVIGHPETLAGRSSKDKIKEIAGVLKEKKADAAVITLPECVCWLLNIRGSDIPHTPFVNAYGILHADKSFNLFIREERLSADLQASLNKAGVHFNAPEIFPVALRNLSGKKVMCDPNGVPDFIYTALQKAKTEIIEATDPHLLPKAIKNDAEIAAAKECHKLDGVALVRFIAWLKANAAGGKLTEIACVKKLESFRKETGKLKDVSFDSIAGAGENGAIVHYRVTEATNRALKDGDLFLLDSGGQYPEGTTDVTRVFAIGTPTEEMKTRYTQVLKAHIAFATARFPTGKVTGAAIDAITRAPLWQAGIDFNHGTGHGVGAYLSVHEGPQNISARSTVKLQPGMFITNEPGYYKADAFGIRIENIMLVTPGRKTEKEEIETSGFEALTLCPYEKTLIQQALLTAAEIAYVNAYHRHVAESLAPLLGKFPSVEKFLQEACAAL